MGDSKQIMLEKAYCQNEKQDNANNCGKGYLEIESSSLLARTRNKCYVRTSAENRNLNYINELLNIPVKMAGLATYWLGYPAGYGVCFFLNTLGTRLDETDFPREGRSITKLGNRQTIHQRKVNRVFTETRDKEPPTQ